MRTYIVTMRNSKTNERTRMLAYGYSVSDAGAVARDAFHDKGYDVLLDVICVA